MSASIEELRPHLQAFDFRRLFVEGLGWDHYITESFVVRVNDRDYLLNPIAEKAGFVVYECDSSLDNSVPQYPVRRKIESKVAKRTFEHLIIFTDPGRKEQVWQWVRRESGKPAACREYTYTAGGSGDHLLQRIQSLFVSLHEEPSLYIGLVASRVRAAFDIEKVTKHFYERFKTELAAFGEFIEGITAQGDRDWYASLMLNRMMFVYFVQKQGFLDEDLDYLRNRLKMVQEQRGSGRFQQFYRLFLLRLFHEGLGQPEAQRAPELASLLGRVPFLNGGLFDVHDLERDNPDISIPDAAFKRVFDFFDRYRWHLDERPHREDNEINPDVLGYIFEKYVNQKQMGAYYTKEDITGYISRNTVIPFLFDAARKECPVAFGSDGGVWRLLRDDPDRYVYPAVGHGIVWNARQPEDPKRLDAPFDLPEDIAAGIDDVSRRCGWNASAPGDYALPTETWREVVARRQRYQEVWGKLASGEVSEINNLITSNLDIEQFGIDVIAQSEGPELLRAFWQALYGNRERSDTGISVLDPTCGSGAFLFAALNVLEPIYTACLEGMRGFLDDAERSKHERSPKHLGDFRRILEQVDKHPSERYFILKSIVLNNLYGVDIMEEAVEICKLRLFLKLIAQLETYDQIEPLPDIDFNVRTGNTLVGFTSLDAVRQAMTVMPNGQHRQVFPEDQAALDRINEEAEIACAAFNQFRWQQTMLDGEVTSADKQTLRDSLRSLSDELDRHLAAEYGIDHVNPGKHNWEPTNTKDKTKCDRDPSTHDVYACWRARHQPFHWLVEFYGIMSKGGFDVVIGNPPYVEYSRIRKEYEIRGYQTEPCGNLYALCTERSFNLLGSSRRFGFIVQAPIVSTQRMSRLRELIQFRSDFNTYATFDDRPAKLFQGMDHCRVCIVLSRTDTSGCGSDVSTTRYHKWYTKEFSTLFQLLQYEVVSGSLLNVVIPKLRSATEISIYEKILSQQKKLGSLISPIPDKYRIYYKITGVGHWFTFTTSPPRFWRDGVEGTSTRESSVCFSSSLVRDTAFCVLWSTLHYWLYQARTNCRDFNPSDLLSVSIPESVTNGIAHFESLAERITNRLEETSDVGSATYKVGGTVQYQRFSPASAKSIIDEVDRVLAEHYGFTDEELDFIINYDIKYRMGRAG